MNMKRRKRLPLILRLILLLLGLGVLFYGAVVGYVCIREGSVATKVETAGEYDAIVVLGAQVLPDGTPNVQLSWRLDAAKEAFDSKNVPIVVCGAQGKDEPVTEAESMRQYLMDRGVPGEMILMDGESFNTRQNLLNAGRLLKDRPEVKKILIVTSDYHVPRAMALAEDQGFRAVGLGSPCKQDYWIKNHFREGLAWIKYWCVKYLHLPLE